MTENELLLVAVAFVGAAIVGIINAACGDPLALSRRYRR